MIEIPTYKSYIKENVMKISIACDHGALALKNTLRDYLASKGH